MVVRVLERMFCGCVWLLWTAALVSRPGAPAEERPKAPDSSGEACRCLSPNRTMLPSW